MKMYIFCVFVLGLSVPCGIYSASRISSISSFSIHQEEYQMMQKVHTPVSPAGRDDVSNKNKRDD